MAESRLEGQPAFIGYEQNVYVGSYNEKLQRFRIGCTEGIGSETRAMLADDALRLWHFSPLAIFDMWENEVATGDPRNSLYLRGDELE